MVIAEIISAIVAIVGAIVDTGKAALDVLISFFQSVFSLLQSFVQSAPTPMKVVIFLFFILTFSNVFSSFFLSTRYACDGNAVLYETSSISTAMTLMLKTQFQGMSVGDRNTYIAQNLQLSSSNPSPMTIRCVGTSPRIYFYSVDIFDYKMWLLLLVIFYGTPLIWSYYAHMGSLN
jgi:hypothetical protein